MAEYGYQPGACGCCVGCGAFCSDTLIPKLGVSYTGSANQLTPSLYDTPCDDVGGWDCTDYQSSFVTCEPDPGTAELTGTEGGPVTELPAWVNTYTDPPLTDSSYCAWTHTVAMDTPDCWCPNVDGECTWTYNCSACDCWWTDSPCMEPATLCFATSECTCEAIAGACTDNCSILACDSDTISCTALGNPPCCDGLDPMNCAAGHAEVCPVEVDYISGAKGCQFACAGFNMGGCTAGGELDVVMYRNTIGHTVLSARLRWGSCTYTAQHRVGTWPIDCCAISQILSWTYDADNSTRPENNCCCSVPTVTITGVCP